jgi:hypothetical protein
MRFSLCVGAELRLPKNNLKSLDKSQGKKHNL